jgi:hypothetical protein
MYRYIRYACNDVLHPFSSRENDTLRTNSVLTFIAKKIKIIVFQISTQSTLWSYWLFKSISIIYWKNNGTKTIVWFLNYCLLCRILQNGQNWQKLILAQSSKNWQSYRTVLSIIFSGTHTGVLYSTKYGTLARVKRENQGAGKILNRSIVNTVYCLSVQVPVLSLARVVVKVVQ